MKPKSGTLTQKEYKMTRNEKIVVNIRLSLGNASVTWQQLLVNLHNSHHDIKHVYGIKDQGMGIMSISVKCNDRTLITCNFAREPVPAVPECW